MDTGDVVFSVFTTLLIGVIVVSALLLFVFYKLCVKIVCHAEVMIIERLGKYHRTLTPGLHFIVPIIDRPRTIFWRCLEAKMNSQPCLRTYSTNRIDLREHVIDFGKQHVITKDTVQIWIDALVYYQITDPQLAVYNIQDLPVAIELLTQSTLRNIIAQLSLDDTFSSREQINSNLLERIVHDAERWGITVHRVEILNIQPPQDIKNAMEEQIRSERERRSKVLSADGERESSIVKSKGQALQKTILAESDKTARIQLAEGEADSKILIANAEVESIQSIRSSMDDSTAKAPEYLIATQYLAALQDMTAANSEVTLIPRDSVDVVSEMLTMHGQGKK